MDGSGSGATPNVGSKLAESLNTLAATNALPEDLQVVIAMGGGGGPATGAGVETGPHPATRASTITTQQIRQINRTLCSRRGLTNQWLFGRPATVSWLNDIAERGVRY